MLEKSVTFIASCDFCPNDFDTDEYTFVEAVEQIKRAGWAVYKEKGEWFHKCDACREGDADKDFGLL